ncbi:CPXCG motif-containing cysteine-rich protein [Psychromonas sp. Urea-02u-13]|uniref:CPXCG motif-containing cysteine-rich protein n=1 Tax=Psychromonas sp. Urea-02u-13 TaxID=2058326 RepID=UPI000C322436|nr:CPXCG motif-containing cysteine-rich protein [Psychromonas sp. Urea-02u-13]PKG40284.1 CPXCG motif-containing cysteine-rich protein [Psychromonas sp. Urea-02u-13]
MNQLAEKSVDCPYCGETIEVLIDSADVDQQYIEDCQVCCKPITFLVTESEQGEVVVRVYSEDDAY